MKRLILIIPLLITACATSERPASDADADADTKVEATPQHDVVMEFFQAGYEQLSYGNTKKAIDEFAKVLALCEGQFSDPRKVYTARLREESLFYLMKASTQNKEAIVVDTACSDALYLSGYAHLDLGKLDLAQDFVQRAVNMAPMNSMYLSEMGHILQTLGDWSRALEIFQQSEQAAQQYSPPQVQQQELGRAKRGVGYNLIELGQLDKAEAKFKECLEINSEDAGALRELEYIANLRAQGRF